jgi:signal transduction histidine kinase
MLKFLLIDDNPGDRSLIMRQLTTQFANCNVQVITNQAELDDALEIGDFNLVITDFLLHWSDGLTILQAIKNRYPKCPVIMFTASGSQEIAVEAMKSGLDDYLIKSPSHYVRIPIAIRSILQINVERDFTRKMVLDYQNSQKQVEQLAKLNQLKDDFLSLVTHELRTPITNMKMAIRMLKLASSDDQRQRYLNILETECDREAELVDNLLDLQRLEASPDSAFPRELDSIQNWLPSLIDGFRGRLQERQQILQVDLPDLPPICVDHVGLKRILAELLNNACKYTDAGGQIFLMGEVKTYASQPDAADLRSLIFTVRNQAEIPLAALSHIFEKFYRVPQSDRWKQGGTGLGLALVKELLHRMNGTIFVESENGWTTFTVHIKDV